MPVLSLQDVTKRYASLTAVDHLSFEVAEGRIFGLLGPNGAGKTSAIRMITHIILPDEGEVLFDGRRVDADAQERMGYLPEERGLYRKMRVADQLVYLAMLKGMNRTDAETSTLLWLDRFEALDLATKRTRQLSKGWQQKMQFIATVAHDPELVILDEPFSGLDPINAVVLRDVIYEMRDAGKTILFASHRLEQVEQICDDICLIANGKRLISGALRDVKRSFGHNTVVIEFDGDAGFLDRIQERAECEILSRSQRDARIQVDDPKSARVILETAVANAFVSRFEVVEPSLNEIFISVVDGARK